MPTPVLVSGRVQTPSGTPAPAELWFTAADITDRLGQRLQSNFEYRAHVHTEDKAGRATYSILLPPGDYQVVARPDDEANAQAVVRRAIGGQGNLMTGVDIDVSPLLTLTGTAVVADGRPLSDALVVALPTQCPDVLDPANPAASCLPRSARTITGQSGSFSLSLDAGQYVLSVRPVDGSRLPWVNQTLVMPPVSPLAPIVIPAPISVGRKITDSGDFAEVNAVVRLFTRPSPGTATTAAVLPVEVGRAMTGFDGTFEMYIAPAAQ
jgi:hypothetical protein